jgi:hypothetical protein
VIRLVVNLAASEAGWLACVSGAANGMPWAGPLVVLALVAIHLWLSKRPGPELTLVILAVMIGLVADSVLVVTGLVSYPSGTWIEGLAPYWILAMWAMFATTLNVSMRWLRNRNALAAALGAVFGPLAYLAGQEFGAITFNRPALAIAALAVIWAAAMPLLVALARRLDGVSEKRAPDFVLRDWRASRAPQATRRTRLGESGNA